MHSSATFLIEFGAIILALGLLGRFAGRFQFSPIPLYLLAGLAFGKGGLLPLGTSEDFVAIGAEIGVILLLLMLGLEYTASDLVSNLKTQYTAGLVDAALNALPGAAMALLLGWGPVAAVVLAGVTWVSSSGVIAKVLGDLGRLGNRETPVILSILVLEDLSMAVYLPIITALLAGTGLVAGSVTLAIALGAAALVLLVAVRYGRHISRFVSSDDPEKLLLVVLGLTLLVAGLAQQLQVSAAVGAFLVGIALSGEAAEGAHSLLSPAGPVRRSVLRLLRLAYRPGQHPAGPAARARPGGRHRRHEDRHRLLGRPARGDLRQGPLAGGRHPGRPRRVLHRHRRTRRRRRHRTLPRPAGHGVRTDPGHPRPAHRPLHRTPGHLADRAATQACPRLRHRRYARGRDRGAARGGLEPPRGWVRSAAGLSRNRAMPAAPNSGVPLAVSTRLPGSMSRCTTPWRWAACAAMEVTRKGLVTSAAQGRAVQAAALDQSSRGRNFHPRNRSRGLRPHTDG